MSLYRSLRLMLQRVGRSVDFTQALCTLSWFIEYRRKQDLQLRFSYEPRIVAESHRLCRVHKSSYFINNNRERLRPRHTAVEIFVDMGSYTDQNIENNGYLLVNRTIPCKELVWRDQFFFRTNFNRNDDDDSWRRQSSPADFYLQSKILKSPVQRQSIARNGRVLWSYLTHLSTCREMINSRLYDESKRKRLLRGDFPWRVSYREAWIIHSFGGGHVGFTSSLLTLMFFGSLLRANNEFK